MNLADRISTLITASPAERWTLIETIESALERLPGDVVVAFDGVRPEDVDLSLMYERYLDRVVAQFHDEERVIIDVHRDWGHQANNIRLGLQQITTPCLLFLEQDTPLMDDCPWEQFCDAMEGHAAHVIRLNTAPMIPDYWQHCYFGDRAEVCGAMMWRTSQWSQWAHLANTEFYRRMIDRYFAPESRTLVEIVMHSVLANDHARNLDTLRVYTYTPDGDQRRAVHLDGRGSRDVYDMIVRYPDGLTPEGAPTPSD